MMYRWAVAIDRRLLLVTRWEIIHRVQCSLATAALREYRAWEDVLGWFGLEARLASQRTQLTSRF